MRNIVLRQASGVSSRGLGTVLLSVVADAAVGGGACEVDVAAVLPGTPALSLAGGERPTGPLVW